MSADEDNIAKRKPVAARDIIRNSNVPSVDDLLTEQIGSSVSRFDERNHKSKLVDRLMETEGLIKIYDDRRVVDGVDIHVNQYYFYGFDLT